MSHDRYKEDVRWDLRKIPVDVQTGQDHYDEHLTETDGEPYIVTSTGRQFYPLNPRPEDVSIIDIAAHLGNLCRFTGATKQFYSVAQHCCLVSSIVDPELALVGLLHDAGEAYASDISAPFKSALPDYKGYEKQINEAVRQAFNIPVEQWTDPQIKEADLIALKTEVRDLMPKANLFTSLENVDVSENRIHAWKPDLAPVMFLSRYAELTGGSKTALLVDFVE